MRFRPLQWLLLVFLACSTATRIALLAATGMGVPVSAQAWGYVFMVGLGYDLVAFVYFAWPLVLLLWLLPRRWLARWPGRVMLAVLCLSLLLSLLFIAVAEWTFWDEFQSRFNFIAVDYLVYTTEVIGNIRESYPMVAIFTGIGVLGGAIFLATRRCRQVVVDRAGFASRSAVAAVWLLATVLTGVAVSADMKDRDRNTHVNELAGNGIYQFFAAYRSHSLDYDRFYRTVPVTTAFAQLRRQLATPDARFTSGEITDIGRDIHNDAPERRLNVVLVSVESLSADFSGTYGARPSLTPGLDALGDQSLVFSSLYASGTRTVRGLEALALSVPPTPGESIVKRGNNEGLFSLASVFNRKGYRSQFIYGGYGAFDNMNYFFGNNGYDVHDRQQIPDDQIHASNIWGVADEDLYTLALQQFDAAYAEGKPFFAHVMTTSNHRPYTFPAGRGPWPQGSRQSAVQYTDWAVTDFLKRARSKPWFANTVFVITADHCASSAGKAAVPVFRYHIPMWIYAPGLIAPGRFEPMLSQIDIAPTILGLLGMDYHSEFYGADVFQREAGRERAFIGTYQVLGYLRGGKLIELSPHQRLDTMQADFGKDDAAVPLAEDPALSQQAISYYQTAAYRFTNGLMKARRHKADVIRPLPADSTLPPLRS